MGRSVFISGAPQASPEPVDADVSGCGKRRSASSEDVGVYVFRAPLRGPEMTAALK